LYCSCFIVEHPHNCSKTKTKQFCKSCRIFAAYLTSLDIIHEQNLLQPMTALHCSACLFCDIISWLLWRLL